MQVEVPHLTCTKTLPNRNRRTMKKNTLWWLLFSTAVILILILTARTATSTTKVSEPEEIKLPPKPVLTHQQEVWRSALEWCESRGVKEAINPKDKDSTPSYYSWQFKPSTFKNLGILYGVLPKETTNEQIPELLKDYQLQKDIVGFMITDKGTKWEQQFPDCVKRKIGRPPVVK